MSNEPKPKIPSQEAAYICWEPDSDEVEFTRVTAPNPRSAAEYAAKDSACAAEDVGVTIAVVRADGGVMRAYDMGKLREGKLLFFRVELEWECSADASHERVPAEGEEAYERLRGNLEELGLDHVLIEETAS